MKNFLIFQVVGMLVLFCSPIKSITSQTLEDSLLIYYPFNGDSFDSSGNNYHPTLFRATFVEDRNGSEESALYFNGIDDLIILPDTQSLKPPLPISIAFWVKLDDLTPQHGVFFTNDFYRFAHSGVWLNLSSSQKLAISYGDGYGFSQYNRKTKESEMQLESDRWYHIAGVVVNEDDLRMYINGMEVNGTLEGGADFLNYVGTGGNIGRKDANYQISPFFFKGYFDEFRYWNRLLGANEVWDLYKEETAIVGDNLVNPSVNIYPNPATTELFIDYLQTDPNCRVLLIDVTGKIIYQGENVQVFDISTIPNGLYFIKIEGVDNNQTIVRKFVKW